MTRNSEFKQIQIKNFTYYYFADVINMNDFNLKLDKESCKDTLIYYMGYETLDDVNPLYIDFKKKMDIEGSNGSKRLTIPDNRNIKVILKIMQKHGIKSIILLS